MIAAIYARKSTAQDVAEDAKSVTRQIDGAKVFIAAKGWTLNEHHVYTDDGVSGALFTDRAEYQRMMRDAAAGAFEALVFFDLDRLGRDGHKTMNALHALADSGVAVWDFSTGVQIKLDTFEHRLPTILKAEFDQQYKDQIRKVTTAAMWRKAEQGYVTGGKVFGYDNIRIAKGQVERVINDQEAVIVREIYTRAADGEGNRSIAARLNHRSVPSPRAQQGRPSGWSATTIRAVLERPLYRGEVIYGRTAKAYGRELGKQHGKPGKRNGKAREKGMIPKPEDRWLRRENHKLRIIDPDLAERVDARRLNRRTRYLASVANGGRVPERAHGKYLLSGGMLICPTCGGHFEARIAPWKGVREVYICSTRRRKPGVCTNTLALPIAQTDDDVLSVVEGQVLGTRFLEELISLVDTTPDPTKQLQAERDRLAGGIDNLVKSIAKGVPAETIAPTIKEYQQQIAKIDVQLRQTSAPRPDLGKLRAALEQRAEQWKSDLRAEPKVARLVLRRVLGPLTLWNPADQTAWVEWEATVTAALLDGLVQLGTSPTGFEPVFWP